MKQRKVDEKRQHSLTDFFRKLLYGLLSAGTFVLMILLLSPLILFSYTPGPSHSKPSQPEFKPSKQKSATSTTVNMLRRSKFPEIPPLTLEEVAPMGVGWPDLKLLKEAYSHPKLQQATTSPSTTNTPSSTNSKQDSESKKEED